MLTALVALASALCLAVSSVLEHRAVGVATGPASSPGRQPVTGLRLLGRLLRSRVWLVGATSALLGFVLHGVALRGGSLLVVQPLLVSGLLFALPLSVVLAQRRPRMREWFAALVVVGGLAVFLLAARPGGGGEFRDAVLAASVGVGAGLIGVCMWLARTVLARHRAVLLGTAGGLAHGAAAALLKRAVELPDRPAFAGWAGLVVLAALLGALLTALLLTQAAYAAGGLSASLPSLTVVDPVAAVLIGVLAFGEQLSGDAVGRMGQLVGLVLVTGGVLRLAAWQQAGDGAAVPVPIRSAHELA